MSHANELHKKPTINELLAAILETDERSEYNEYDDIEIDDGITIYYGSVFNIPENLLDRVVYSFDIVPMVTDDGIEYLCIGISL